MQFGKNRLQTPSFYNGQPQNFVPWSQQANQMFHFASQFSQMPFLPPNIFPPNLLIQQQNNYYNSTLPSPPPFVPNTHSQILSHNLTPYIPWLPRSIPPKNSNNFSQKVKNIPELISLDEDSMSNVVVIDDSSQQKVPAKVPKKDDKLKNEIQKSGLKLQYDRQLKQKDFLNEVKKNENNLPPKRQNRNSKYCTSTLELNKKQVQAKLPKKKTINKDRFVYKFSAHEKHLSELSQYRQYFPNQTVTGPQFQAKLPHLRLFGTSFGGLREKTSWLGVRREKLLSRLQSLQHK